MLTQNIQLAIRDLDRRVRALCSSAFVTLTIWPDRFQLTTCSSTLPINVVAATAEEAMETFAAALIRIERSDAKLAQTLGIEEAA